MLTGQAKKDYQKAYMQQRRLKAKNKDITITDLKQALENAPGSLVSPELGKTPPVRPRKLLDPNRSKYVRPVRPFAGELSKDRQVSQKGFNE